MKSSRTLLFTSIAAFAAACADPSAPVAPVSTLSAALDRSYGFGYESDDDDSEFLRRFLPLSASATCTIAGGDPVNPLVLPTGYTQKVIASEPSFITNGDMMAFNIVGAEPGRYLYRAHETGPNTGISVTDLKTGVSKMLVQRQDWVGLDGIIATPWGTLLFAEELGSSAGNADPDFPSATAGLVYELDPKTLVVKVRPALGARSHEGQAIDSKGAYYGISERNGGAIFKFVPDVKGDYSSGQLYALKLTTDLGDRTGPGTWVALDRTASKVNSDVEATAKGATGYGRPEDVALLRRGNREILYVALTSEDRVIAIDLTSGSTPVVSTVVKNGVNAPADFKSPDNLVFDNAGNLYVTEDPGSSFPSKTLGDDIWVAKLGASPTGLAAGFFKFASINDCDAEPTGIIFDRNAKTLYVNIQHRGGDGLDKTMAIRRFERDDDEREDRRDR